MWIDSDALMSKFWDVDPVQFMVENNLALLYSGFPYGVVRNEALGRKLMDVYNTSICGIDNDEDRSISARPCVDSPASMGSVARMHHITNLDVYRKDVHQRFLKKFVGDYRFSRLMDDQIAVTIVALMEQYLQRKGKKRVIHS